jgi:hypothetical protein
MSLNSRSLFVILSTTCFVLSPLSFPGYFNSRVNAQSAKPPVGYLGVWKGAGAQDNGSKWTILIALTPGKINSIAGTVAYPSLNCGGELTLKRSSFQALELAEKITYGDCVDQGTMVLKLISIGKLQFNWFYPDGKAGAIGRLQKI